LAGLTKVYINIKVTGIGLHPDLFITIVWQNVLLFKF
jgi:hypothetical protein